MTVSTTAARVVYLGDGSTTAFAFAFKVQQPTDLVVVYTDATGVDYSLSPSQYTATGFGQDAGGSVVYPTVASGSPAIGVGTRLTIYRDVQLTQPASVGNQSAFWPSVIEAALDRLTFIAQKIWDRVGRSLSISATDSVALNPLPNATQRANSVLAFDSQGQPFAAVLQPAGLISWATWIVQNFAPAASPAAARGVLGAVGMTGDETIAGNKTFSGRAIVPTRTAGDNGTDAASTAFVKAKAESVVGGAVLRSYLAGLGLSNNTGSPNTKIDVSAGVCADGGNAQMLTYAGGTLDCATVGANGLDAGSLANNTWYHVFVIGKTDGTTALLASTSLGSPAMPSGYTLKRRVGSFKTNGSAQILAFTQNGDYFRWAASVLDVSDTNPGTNAQTKTMASVPPGAVMKWIGNLNLKVSSTGTSIYVSDPAGNNEAPTAYNAPTPAAPGHTLINAVGGNIFAQQLEVFTNASQQIRYRLSASGGDVIVGLITLGFIDRRGRDA